jgi:hypothetical protein
VAPAGRNGSSERVFRGFSPGAGEKNPFGRASSEAGGEAVNEALPKGLIYTIITVALYMNITFITSLTDVTAFIWISYIFTPLSYVA